MDDALLFIQNLVRVKLRGQDAGGRLAVVELSGPPGDSPPLHRHTHQDEAFYVLDGRMTVYVDDQRIALEPGAVAFGPRGLAHTYLVDESGPARWLAICAPAGFDAFIEGYAIPAGTPSLPPPPSGPPDSERLNALAAEHGIEILGPPGMLPVQSRG